MAIQQYMGIITVIFCIILAFNIMAVVSIEEKKTQEEFIGQLFDPASGLLTEDTFHDYRQRYYGSLAGKILFF